MQEYLIISMSSDPQADVSWVALQEGGRLIGFPQSGPLAGALAKSAGRQVVVVVPGEDVTHAEVKIPTQKRQRLLRAIPYALEDQLAEDVDKLHFALGPRNTDGGTPVVVVARSRMDAWQRALAEAGLQPTRCIPEVLALPLPVDEVSWTVVVQRHRVLVRTGAYSGFTVDADNFQVVLDAALAKAEPKPARLLVHRCGDAPELSFVGEDLEWFEQPCDGGLLSLIATGYRSSAEFDLLQGNYSRSERLEQMWRPWRLTAGLAAAYLLVALVINILTYADLQDELARLDQDIEQVYRKAFPDAVRIVNPRVQMEQKLAELQRGGAGQAAGFIELVAVSGDVLRSAKGVTINNGSFRDGRLDLELTVETLQLLDTLKRDLIATGELEVDIQSAVADADQRVQSRLRLRGISS